MYRGYILIDVTRGLRESDIQEGGNVEMLNVLKNTLSQVDAHRLQTIYEPTVVGVPLQDARIGMCVMPDGEIRSYGFVEKTAPWGYVENEPGVLAYVSSRNCGLDWKLFYTHSNHVMSSCVQSPLSGKFIRVIVHHEDEDEHGVYVRISETGPDDENYREIKITDEIYGDYMLPMFLKKRNRWICPITRDVPVNRKNPTVLYSDDDGESWNIVHLKSAPNHEVKWPHKSTRWQNSGCEPSVTELEDGTLMLIARTSLDYLYVYYSYDGGENWTDGELSDFHSTLTTPGFLKLSDGRILLFWNNTRPMAERDHRSAFPPVEDRVINGWSEDAFTNRDACHVAISEDDGRTWTGFRELFLNELRNKADFRAYGGMISSADKSVQQFQALELPYNKVLVQLGQHEAARKTVIFDLNWLYEKERHEDWQLGLKNLSTHMFVKSVSGSYVNKGFAGHCSWNRTCGALLVPDPDGTCGEVLQICRVKDERMVSDLQGAVWNFPSADQGDIKIQIRVAGSGVKINMCDHWINPTDEYVDIYSSFTWEITGEMLQRDVWHELVISFDTESGIAKLQIEDMVGLKGEQSFTKMQKIKNAAPHGLSYLHIQTLAEETDFKGTYIRKLDYQGK